MGTLRILLALWVVAVHGEGLLGIPTTQAWVAVQCFFIISGFYITLILNEKYVGPGSIRLFLSQRFLRLLPVYWAILLLTLAASGLAWGWWGHAFPPLQTWIDHGPSLSSGTRAFLGAINLTLFGQAEVLFLGLDPTAPGTLNWTPRFDQSEPLVWNFLALPQAWSIELELFFYVLAPFIVRRSLPVIIVLFCISFSIRLACYTAFGLRFDPWTYRFFPNELGTFLLGSVSYAIYKAPWRARASEGLWIWALFALFFLLTLTFPYIPIPGQLKAWPYYGLATLTIPFLFAETKHWRWDRYIGELSYPVYLIHFLVIWILQTIIPTSSHHWLGLAAIAGSVAASILLVQSILTPFERWRAQRAQRLLP